MKAHASSTAAPSRLSVGGTGTTRASRQSLRDTAYEAIKHRIMTCAFRPGERINEVQVASLIGLGRTPVHQALDRLMREDMVEVIPRKGVIVKPVSLHEVMQMVEVRLINETYCARLAAERAENEHVQELENIFAHARKAIASQNIRRMMFLDGRFHHVLASAARNDDLVKILRTLNERSLRFWFISFRTPDHHDSFQEQHGAILEGVRSRDPEAAESAMRSHIEAFRASVARHL